MTKSEERQRLIRQYKVETGRQEVDLHDVARWAFDRGYQSVRPFDPVEAFAKQLSRAAREETRKDPVTGRPYRANHAIRDPGTQAHTWFDIDEAPPRERVLKSLVQRREQMVGDALQLTLDADHWNRINPGEEEIQLPLDFTFDVELRLQDEDNEQAS